ncbi:MAG: hypothetical protein LBM93_12430 [Oscillospiraceae bacterium]|jgi:hypothetical protein|nr:hypothetical protein [Oscillospiraceae bacterium]
MKSFLLKKLYPFLCNAFIYLIFIIYYKIFKVDIYDISGVFPILIISLIISFLLHGFLIFLKKLRIYHFIIPNIILYFALLITANEKVDFDPAVDIFGTAIDGEGIAAVIILGVIISQIILQTIFIIVAQIKRKIEKKRF